MLFPPPDQLLFRPVKVQAVDTQNRSYTQTHTPSHAHNESCHSDSSLWRLITAILEILASVANQYILFDLKADIFSKLFIIMKNPDYCARNVQIVVQQQSLSRVNFRFLPFITAKYAIRTVYINKDCIRSIPQCI